MIKNEIWKNKRNFELICCRFKLIFCGNLLNILVYVWIWIFNILFINGWIYGLN